MVGRYVTTGSLADRSLRGDLVWILFWRFMNVFLDYRCLVSMNQRRLVQDFTAKFFVKIYLRRLLLVKMFMLIFTDIWMLTSPCPFLTPTKFFFYLWDWSVDKHRQLTEFVTIEVIIEFLRNLRFQKMFSQWGIRSPALLSLVFVSRFSFWVGNWQPDLMCFHFREKPRVLPKNYAEEVHRWIFHPICCASFSVINLGFSESYSENVQRWVMYPIWCAFFFRD